MSGERDLRVLLSNMNPSLSEGEFVFCSLDEARLGKLEVHPIATFRESEAISAIIPRQYADDEGLEYSFVAKLITIGVHSSLDAVGLIAAIAGKLAEAGISVNPVSAYFHDYLFVPTDKAHEAMAALEEMIGDSAMGLVGAD